MLAPKELGVKSQERGLALTQSGKTGSGYLALWRFVLTLQ